MTPEDQKEMEIPSFFRRETRDEAGTPAFEGESIDSSIDELSLDELMARIKKMEAQRDLLTAAITRHKKAAQRLIGSM